MLVEFAISSVDTKDGEKSSAEESNNKTLVQSFFEEPLKQCMYAGMHNGCIDRLSTGT